MNPHLALLKKSFTDKTLDFAFGPGEPHFLALKEFHDDQMSKLHDLQQSPEQGNGPSDTYLHSYRVANDVFVFATFIGLSHQMASNLRWAVLLHDIGKLDVNPDVLNKPGRLSDEEFAEMKNHTKYGAERLRSCGIDHPIVKLAAELALYHHERLDGRGYIGLKDKEIPARIRLIQLCDIFDAVSAPRVYRTEKEQLTPYETMKNILDPGGFLHPGIDMMFARPYCLLKLNLMEGDLSKEHHRMLEDYLVHPENYPEDAYAPPATDFLRVVD